MLPFDLSCCGNPQNQLKLICLPKPTHLNMTETQLLIGLNGYYHNKTQLTLILIEF